MSEAEEEEVDAEEEEAEEPDAPDAPDGQPEIEPDEQADLDGLDLDGADLDPDPAPEADGDSGEVESAEGMPGTSADAEADPAGAGQWGDMYVSLLSQTTTAIIEEHGDGTEVGEDHFRQVDLDQHFNRTMEKFAGGSDMEPERALVIGTLIGVGGPVALHTDLLQEAFDAPDLRGAVGGDA